MDKTYSSPSNMDDDGNVSDPGPTFEQWMAFYNDTKEFERKIGIIIPSIFALIIVVGIVGNLLVVVVALNRAMRNSTNTLIIGLAISDLMFLLLCVPFTAIDYALPVWIFPEWTCSMINFFQHISAYCSVWTLTLMALDRYLAVVYPVDSLTLRSPRNTIIALVVVYTIIVATQIPVGLMHGIYSYDFIIEKRSTCAIVRTYFITFNVFGYILPLGISVFLYWRMLRRLWDTPRPGNSNATNGSLRSRPETRRAKRKVTRLVLCVLVIWAVCWLPLNVCFFVSGFIRVICTIGRKLTMNACCKEDDKQMRLEFTTCNNTTVSTSIRRFQTSAKGKGFSERSLLLRDRPKPAHKKAFEMAQDHR
ncbi:7 transmembrane receptor [Ancylostoma ceylanicum]|uniref:7 transmembrane receptor n=1 Tax=Ancylostoma ceylanicum TaxID=53326 RepID=A0A0D6MA29_9BILA|nr:7 transmembrane receptor [Ancylostoma ceylanicum]